MTTSMTMISPKTGSQLPGPLGSFFAFPGFTGVVSVTAADVNHDGFSDVIVGASVNGHVKMYDGKTGALFFSQLVLPGTTGPISLAAGDVSGDGFADVIVGAGAGVSGNEVTILDGSAASGNKVSVRGTLNPFNGFPGGVRVGTEDRAGDLLSNIVVGSGTGAMATVQVFDALTLNVTLGLFPFGAFPGGVFVSNAGH